MNIMKAGAALGIERVSVISGDELNWQLKALCRGKDSRIFFPKQPNMEQKAEEAKAICRDCPVLNQCRRWALTQHEQWGVWGGMSEGDRDAFWEGKPISRPRRRYRSRVGHRWVDEEGDGW